MLHVWPEGNQGLGYGRGILAGGSVYWPARHEIFVFNEKTALPERVINLLPRGVGGGNLLFAAGRLLLAGPDELVALNVRGQSPPVSRPNVGWGDRSEPHQNTYAEFTLLMGTRYARRQRRPGRREIE